ncbi:GNAT family N-acetyltransferase [Amnibacterium kyonggiense]|uniref:Acetyltransferase (GNAT) family protein n=1 Tax=Amnibacterium kyonggiense TaxID=595671 RepID=A0A4R7FHG7_9MICO|nr:GNAT family N-acetyltransferase [Amnibacterium kyonggiense]TDS75614.1 acetyltransferase (GNAT) family protein [Amnibacterium kyonggiense]
MAYRIRRATRADASFLVEMACEAANRHPDRVRPKADLLADPAVMRYARGWKRPADDGVVAVDDSGESIGACWYRVLPRNDAGHGFVASGVPELTLGVRPMWRARGVGRALLEAACDLARESGHQRVSLSVERANFAERLYRSEGFVVVESGADADTMVRALR